MYNLVFWTIVALQGASNPQEAKHDWRFLGEYNSLKACQTAAEQLNIDAHNFRCLKKD